ncbi:MAG: hypothetical protein U0892_15690 [Pirellulales bacterium]
MRFSVTTLLGLVTLSAVCVSALLASNELAMKGMVSLTLLLSIVSLSASVFGSSSARTWALGFLIGCLPYLYCTQFIKGDGMLLTDSLLDELDARLEFSRPDETPAGETVELREDGIAEIRGPRGSVAKTWADIKKMGYQRYAYAPGERPTLRHYKTIGHFAFAMIVGCLNGLFASWLVRRSIV